jgi:hypothetical protein
MRPLCSGRRHAKRVSLAFGMRDVSAVCPTWQKTDGRGGYASIEADPDLASNT